MAMLWTGHGLETLGTWYPRMLTGGSKMQCSAMIRLVHLAGKNPLSLGLLRQHCLVVKSVNSEMPPGTGRVTQPKRGRPTDPSKKCSGQSRKPGKSCQEERLGVPRN